MENSSKEKQIEEMANDINMHCCSLAEQFCGETSCNACLTNFFYNAGYRKQSEGRWEKRVFIIFDSEKVGFRCSECNTTWDIETHYCPNCGAKMKGGGEE